MIFADSARDAGGVKHQHRLQLSQRRRPDAQRIDDGLLAGELHEVDAAKGSGVLILPPPRLADIDALDLIGQPRDIVFTERQRQQLPIGLDHCHHQRRG